MNPNNPTTAPGQVPAIWLAARFLLPLGQEKHADDANWRYAGRWFILWGLLIGIFYAAVFRMSWRFFGEYQYIRFAPAAVVLVADLAFGGYRLLAGLTTITTRDRQVPGTLTLPTLLAVVLLTILKYALLLSVPTGVPRPMEAGDWLDWRARIGILYPQAIYRPLILMPLWGRWAMTLAMSIGRCSPESSERLRRMASGVHLPLIMMYWLFGAVLTVLYASGAPGHLARGVVIALLVMVIAYAASFILAQHARGQNEATVGTVGLTAEIAFLALYLSISSRIYWY